MSGSEQAFFLHPVQGFVHGFAVAGKDFADFVFRTDQRRAQRDGIADGADNEAVLAGAGVGGGSLVYANTLPIPKSDFFSASSWAELAVVAPASADLCSRIALGLAGDLVTTALLALPRDVPRLIAPAMNPNMLANPATQRNLARLREDGWEVMEPEEGHMACGVEGRGRFPAPQAIADRVAALLAG